MKALMITHLWRIVKKGEIKMKLELYESQTPIEMALAVDEQGMTSARKVYSFLKLDPSNYSKWCKNNIVDNEFFEQGIDFTPFVIDDDRNPKPTTDYKLTANFAKKLCMRAGGERGEQARTYFIKVEQLLVKEKTKAVKSFTYNGLSAAERLKLIEILANCPEYALHPVMELASPFMSNATFTAPVGPVPTRAPAVVTFVRQPAANNAGYQTPFNREKLKRHLLSNAISRQDLHRLSGVSKGVIDATINGKTRPGAATRYKLCCALGKPTGWLDG